MSDKTHIVEMIREQRRRFQRSWATELASLVVTRREADSIIAQSLDAEVVQFLRDYAKACTEEAEAECSTRSPS